MSDPTIWLSPAIAVLIVYFYHLFSYAKMRNLTQVNKHLADKLQTQSVLLAERKKAISDLKQKVADLEKQKPTNSQELVDFMQDLKTNGYGVARIDPDSVFYRGTR